MFCLQRAVRLLIINVPGRQQIHIRANIQNKNSNSNRQVRVLQKLLGNRQSGSKKKWYPNDVHTNHQFPTPKSFSKTQNQGKNGSRRVNVLNKLFMKNITDLMCTGEISEELIGKGIEISKVKVTPDFQGINVYWIAKGDSNDAIIETILQRCSGIIRHELSQLRLMGEIPKIYFVKDKTFSNVAEVQVLLDQCDFGDEDHEIYDPSNELRNELNLESNQIEPNNLNDLFPKMRHDVMGLDREDIMNKILTKLKKAKQAWEKHEQNENQKMSPNQNTVNSVRKKIEITEITDEKFEKFLLKRNAKNTPERKKNLIFDEDVTVAEQIDNDQYDRTKYEGDYIDENDNKKV